MKHNLIFQIEEQLELMLAQVPHRTMGQLRGRLGRQAWWVILIQIQRALVE